MNMAAPAVIKADHMSAAMHLMGYCLQDDPRSVALVVMPSFSYTKNGLWNEANAVMKHLSVTGAHCDRSWYLQYKEKCARVLMPYRCNDVSWRFS